VFTSFDIAAETHELKDTIVDSRVNNIYQLDPNTLLFKLHKTDTPPLLLLLEAGRRFHLTSYAQEKPESPPAFCMALRKYLRNAWMRKVEQYEFERIVAFIFETKEGLLKLVLELFGDGNLILTDKKEDIVQALIFKRMRDRNIIRGEAYASPPSSGRNPFKTSREELAEDLKKCGDAEVVRALARGLGVGGVYAEEILLRAGIEKTTPCMKLTDAEVGAIYEGLRSLIDNLANARFEPRIILSDNGTFLDVVPFQLKRYEACKAQTFSSFNEALDQFYLRVTSAEKAAGCQTKVDQLKREADRLRRVLGEQEKTIREAETKVEQEKLAGDAIYANSTEVQALLDTLNVARTAGKDLRSVTSQIITLQTHDGNRQVMVEDFDPRNGAVTLHVGELRFNVNLRRSLFENAAQYYEHGKKTKQKAVGALTALEESRRKLAEIERKIQAAEVVQRAKPEELMKQMAKLKVESKEWFEKFRWFISSDGLLVVAGKDAVSNEVLVKKHVEKDDPVFHADVTGAPFVVIKAEGKPPSEQTLREASEFAAAFSRAWREGLASADVYWVKPDQLKKTGPSGEYVAHGAFAIVGKRNWMRSVPLQTAIGIVENREKRFMGGPVDAVKAKATVYVTLVPGEVMGKEILKQVLHVLALKSPKELRESILKTSIEEIREFVPYTMGRIVD